MWVLPTYDRPERAQQTLDSIEKAGCNTPGLVYIDGSQNPCYDNLRLPCGWSVLRGEVNRGVCSALNTVFARYPNCSWYGFISDDSMIRTPCWDTLLLSKADNYTIVHSADGWRTDHRIHGAVIFGGELLRALGWWVPTGLIHSFCDDVWESIADAIDGRRYVPEVMVEHCHFGNGKTAVDRSYLKAYASFDEDKAAFLKWKKEDFELALKRIAKRRGGS
ncbi:MAG: glycosyltransferase [Parachlamydiales bacterium]|nr:glycosyltransferase [Parachlamydiales bacterium]